MEGESISLSVLSLVSLQCVRDSISLDRTLCFACVGFSCLKLTSPDKTAFFTFQGKVKS